MRLYVIGPVTGRENLNRAAFEDAREKLERAGYNVTIPHDFIPPDASHEDAMRGSIGRITRRNRDGVAMLADFSMSRGAKLEREVAIACGLPTHCVGTWLLMAGVAPENDSPEETTNPPSDGARALSNDVYGELTRRMDETNALLRAVYGQISALTAIETGALAKSTCDYPKQVAREALNTASKCTREAKDYFESAGKDGQDDRKA